MRTNLQSLAWRESEHRPVGIRWISKDGSSDSLGHSAGRAAGHAEAATGRADAAHLNMHGGAPATGGDAARLAALAKGTAKLCEAELRALMQSGGACLVDGAAASTDAHNAVVGRSVMPTDRPRGLPCVRLPQLLRCLRGELSLQELTALAATDPHTTGDATSPHGEGRACWCALRQRTPHG